MRKKKQEHFDKMLNGLVGIDETLKYHKSHKKPAPKPSKPKKTKTEKDNTLNYSKEIDEGYKTIRNIILMKKKYKQFKAQYPKTPTFRNKPFKKLTKKERLSNEKYEKEAGLLVKYLNRVIHNPDVKLKTGIFEKNSKISDKNRI